MMYPATGIRKRIRSGFSKLKISATMDCKISVGWADSTESGCRGSGNSSWTWAKTSCWAKMPTCKTITKSAILRARLECDKQTTHNKKRHRVNQRNRYWNNMYIKQ